MDTKALFTALAAFPDALAGALLEVDDKLARVRPDEDSWALIEIARHMLDEEQRDFRVRLRLTLEGDEEWPAIDPEGWVTEHAYISASLAPTLLEFRKERAISMSWLEGLESPNWRRSRVHPLEGRLRAGDLLTAWVAHDSLHLAQLARTKVALASVAGAPYHPDYAGGQ